MGTNSLKSVPKSEQTSGSIKGDTSRSSGKGEQTSDDGDEQNAEQRAERPKKKHRIFSFKLGHKHDKTHGANVSNSSSGSLSSTPVKQDLPNTPHNGVLLTTPGKSSHRPSFSPSENSQIRFELSKDAGRLRHENVKESTPLSYRPDDNSESGEDEDEESSHSGGVLDDELGANALATEDDGAIRFSVMLNEACEDTPSFRASAEYLDVMFADLDRWLENFSEANSVVIDRLNSVKDGVNDVIKLFMPGVTHSSIFAQDYTTLLFGRYTEAEQVFWTDVFVNAAKTANDIVTMVKRLRKTVFLKYRHAREYYLVALQEHDSCLLELFQLPQDPERAAQREAVRKMHNARRKLLRTASKLVIAISEVETETSLSLLETMSSHFMIPDNGVLAHEHERVTINIEFHRLQAAASALRKSLPRLALKLKRTRRHFLEQSRQLGKQDVAKTSSENSEISTKFGWVNVELQPRKWTLLWAFLQHGLFGFLSLSENKTAVVESTKIFAADAKFVVLDEKDRRCLFRVSDNDGNAVTVQASSQRELDHWQQAFENASKMTVSRATSTVHRKPSMKRNNSSSRSLTVEKKSNSENQAWSRKEIYPWNSSFAIPEYRSKILPESNSVVEEIERMRRDLLPHKGLRYESTLTSRGAMDFDMHVPSVIPLPTSVQLEAVIANSFFHPSFTCNAITANLWGSTGLPLNRPSVEHSAKNSKFGFPRYPENYAASLMMQDMDLRCILAQLPDQEAPFDDEILLSVLRGATDCGGGDFPVRLYVTSHRLLIYGAWCGFVYLNCYKMESLLDVETKHGVDYSLLTIAIQKSEHAGTEAGINEVIKAVFKLFVDSSVLARRKLDFVKDNSRLKNRPSSNELLDALALISVEHGELLSQHEKKLVQSLKITAQDMASSEGTTKDGEIPGFISYALGSPIGDKSSRGEEDALNLGGGMSSKLIQDTYPISVDTVFIVMFGPHSPVFSGYEQGLMDSTCEPAPWYRKGKRLERQIRESISGLGITYDDRFNVQRIEKQRSDLFVVSERRSPWQTPSGYKFYVSLRYVVYATGGGCHLQIWSRIVWIGDKGPKETEKSVEDALSLGLKASIMKLRTATENVHSVEEAIKRFGNVKPVKTVAVENNEHQEAEPTRIGFRLLLPMCVSAYFRMSRRFKHTFRQEAWTLFTPRAIVVLLLMLSLFMNFIFYRRYSSQYLQDELEARKINSIIDELKLSPLQQNTISRAIYLADIDDLIASGTALWDSLSPGVITGGAPNSSSLDLVQNNACSRRFADVARLSLWSEASALYELEPRVREMLQRITEARLEFALKRNDVLTILKMINTREISTLEGEYRTWLIDESAMCASVRKALPILNSTASEEIAEYCLSCLHEAKRLV